MSGNQNRSNEPNREEQGRDRLMSFDSNSSDQSSISIPSSTASLHSMDNPTKGNFRPNIRAGALALERIQEVSADIEQQRTDRRPVEEEDEVDQEDDDDVQFGGIRKWAQGADEPKTR
ncbi:Hypothetical protein CINCED_3A003917, partial [Cinara cedri]